jgi:hypothetical protein
MRIYFVSSAFVIIDLVIVICFLFEILYISSFCHIELSVSIIIVCIVLYEVFNILRTL